MKLHFKSESAGGAWLRSLPIALLLPVPVWIISEIFTSPTSEKLSSLFFSILGISMIVHLIAYAVFGLPLFFLFFARPNARIWDARFSTLIGASLGIVGICLTFYFFGYPESTFRNPVIYFAGAGYGIATAISAFLTRPINGEQIISC